MRCFLLCEQSFPFDGKQRPLDARTINASTMSQLYVQLLEIVRIDALRDLEHARGVRVSHLDDESEDCELAEFHEQHQPRGEPRNLRLGDMMFFELFEFYDFESADEAPQHVRGPRSVPLRRFGTEGRTHPTARRPKDVIVHHSGHVSR